MPVTREKAKKWKNGITALMILSLLLVAAILAKSFLDGEFNSIESLQKNMEKCGVWAPLALTVFQALQVVIPVVPGFIGPIAGTLMFGPWVSFVCNYVGISAGSIIAYYLARKFGVDIVLLMFSEKTYDKWRAKVENSKHYDRFLFIATLLPLFPDDFLCYFSGLIRMDAKKFNWIIILGKPWCILAYCVLTQWAPQLIPGL